MVSYIERPPPPRWQLISLYTLQLFEIVMFGRLSNMTNIIIVFFRHYSHHISEKHYTQPQANIDHQAIKKAKTKLKPKFLHVIIKN